MPKKTPAKSKKPKTPAQKEQDICFVIMPFGGWLDTYYTDIYIPAITKAGLEPHRADDLFRPSTITSDIWTYTKRSKIVLADLTGKNPNVFYELGLAHALAKPAILVAESMEDVPFDLRSLRVITYNKNAPAWGEALRASIESSIIETLKSPAEAVLPAFLNLADAAPRVTVSEKERDILSLRQDIEALRRELPNIVGAGNRFRHESRIDVGPRVATELIQSLIKSGASDDRIIATVSAMGPPDDWVATKVRRFRETDQPVLFDAAASTPSEETPHNQAQQRPVAAVTPAASATPPSPTPPRSGRAGR